MHGLMKKTWRKILLLILFQVFSRGGLSAQSNPLDITGGFPLEVRVFEDGYMQINYDDSSGWKYQIYNNWSTGRAGTILFLNGTSQPDSYATNYLSTFGPNEFTYSGHTKPNPWAVQSIFTAGATGVQVTKTVTYVNGEQKIKIDWVIFNGSAATYTDVRFIHLQDTWLADQDNGYGHWEASQNMVYISHPIQANTGIMGIYGEVSSPADRYDAGDYIDVRDHALAGELINNVNNLSLEDCGYALQWNRTQLNPGDTWTITMYEEFKSITVPGVNNTAPISNITHNSADSGGDVDPGSGAPVTARGVCWSTSPNPTTADSFTVDGSGTGAFTSNITGLNHTTTYYVRAYATTSRGTGYGNELSFTTPETVPALTTAPATNITSGSALSGGTVTDDGGAAVTARGVCWNTSPGPTTADSLTVDGSGAGSFISTIAGLTPGVTYYARAYATNIVGTSYGDEISFTTLTVPTVITSAVTNINPTSAQCGGLVTFDGGAAVTARGVCWSTSPGPTTADSLTVDGSGTGPFTSSITGLVKAAYYVRAYATNIVGTSYGNEISFSNAAVLPTVTTAPLSDITSTSAAGGGNVTDDGGAVVTVRGVCWNTTGNPSAAGSKTADGAGAGPFTSNITALDPGAKYYVRAYAVNSVGTSYGNEISFVTLAVLPEVTTAPVNEITSNSAAGGGNVTYDGGSPVTARGVCWNTAGNPTVADSKTADGGGTGAFTGSIAGLAPGAKYYVRAYAVNSVGTSYGNEISFATLAEIPTVTTAAVDNITPNSASGGGNVTADGGAGVTARGVCWGISPNPAIGGNGVNITADGSGTGHFSSEFTGLNPDTLYHIRAYATNSKGTAYGGDLTFTTQENPAISGSITHDAAPLPGVTVTFIKDGGDTVSIITDAGGAYRHTLDYGWQGTVIPSKSGYTFDPSEQTYQNVTTHQKNQDYTAALLEFSISGTVYKKTDISEEPFPGVKLAFTSYSGESAGPVTITTDIKGEYRYTVGYGWWGSVKPSISGYDFSPDSLVYPAVTSHQTGQDFIAYENITPTYLISGRVTTAWGETMSGVVLVFSNNGGYAITDPGGEYSHPVDESWAGTVTPRKSGYRFSPANIAYTSVYSDKFPGDYTAETVPFVISGRVADPGGAGIAGIAINFFSPQSGRAGAAISGNDNGNDPGNDTGTESIITDFNGNYSKEIPHGWSGSVTPSMNGYEFAPPFHTFENVMSHQAGVDYTAAASPGYRVISGIVADTPGTGIPGVGISFKSDDNSSILNTWTDANGNYNQPVEYGWSGTAVPSKEGYTVEPGIRTYANVDSDRSGEDYEASTPLPIISGKVTINETNAPLKNVRLFFSDTAPYGPYTYTNATGNYIYAVGHGWSGTAVPSKNGYTFEPFGLSYADNPIVENRTGQDYKAAPGLLFISGNITGPGGQGLGNVALEFSHGAGAALTDENGGYLHPVDYNWEGTVTPLSPLYNFIPEFREYSRVTVNQEDENYTSRANPPVISGHVTYSTSSGISGLSGVTLVFSDGAGSAVTDGDGYYRQAVPKGWSGIITPVKDGFVFFPFFLHYTSLGFDKTHQNFAAGTTTLTLTLEAERKKTDMLVINKHYGEIRLSKQGSSGNVDKYVIYRRETGGMYLENHEIANTQLPGGHTYTYRDTKGNIAAGKTYTYKAIAWDLQGRITGASNDAEI